MKHEILCSKIKPLVLLMMLCFLFVDITYAQQSSSAIRDKLQQIYNNIEKPEITFEKFYEINRHVYENQLSNASKTSLQAAASGPYCSKVRLYCTNGDFESGLDTSQYVGAYGFWYSGLYPDPFALTYGFSSGALSNGSAHQTIVDTSMGKDPITGINLTPANGGRKSLRIGNDVNGNGTELIAKTVVVDPNETILSFYYAVVFEDPGHARVDQPAFSVRAYDCATGQELPNVCDLGNGSNIAVSNAQDPFFKSLNFGSIAYRDWSLAQINLSQYVGRTVIIVFTNKDCNLGGHYGYTYLDNLFSSNCPPPPDTTTNQGAVRLDSTKLDTCGIGQVCVKYNSPYTKDASGKVTATGSTAISLYIYQKNSLTILDSLISPTLNDSGSYCFSIDPAKINKLDNSVGGFDYTITGHFTLSGFATTMFIGNPPTGIKSGVNNDYLITCPVINTNVYYSKPAGALHDVTTWGRNTDGSGANPPDFGAGNTFVLANRGTVYTLTANWIVGGTINIPAGSELQLNGNTLSEAGIMGTGTLTGSATSNLIVIGTAGGDAGTLNFTGGGNTLNNFTLNRTGASASATIGSTALNVIGMLSIQNGMLNTNNRLTLKSTALTTASVAPIAATGNITGNVTVERYIPARRAWRMINVPVSGTQTINAAWQEGVVNASVNLNPNPGFGTHITGGTAANGFDQNLGSMASLKVYSNPANTWVPVTSTATPIGNNAYMLFIRGDRGITLDGPTATPSNTTLRATGTLRIGDQTFPVNAGGFTAIPNPYPSPINLATIATNNSSTIQNNFYVWDPQIGGVYGVGGYINISWNGGSYDFTPAPVSAESQYIQSGQSFFVSSTGAAGSLVIREADKAATTPATNVFRTAAATNNGERSAATQALRINLQITNPDNTTATVDGILTSYSTAYSNAIDNMDALKMQNINENIAIVRAGQSLTVERRAMLDENNDTLFLKLSNTTERSYLLEFQPSNFSFNTVSATLEDQYLHTATAINLSGATQVPFMVTSDPASQNPNRFRVILASGKNVTNIITDKRSFGFYPNPVTGRTINVRFTNQPKGVYYVQLTNSAGAVMYQGRIEHAGGTATQTVQLTNVLAKGMYQMQIKGDNTTTTLKILTH